MIILFTPTSPCDIPGHDWGSLKTEIGLSEFVIKKNLQIIVHEVCDNENFFDGIFNDK